MVVHSFTPHIAKFARFSLGRFTNRWANEEELKLVYNLLSCPSALVITGFYNGAKQTGKECRGQNEANQITLQ